MAEFHLFGTTRGPYDKPEHDPWSLVPEVRGLHCDVCFSRYRDPVKGRERPPRIEGVVVVTFDQRAVRGEPTSVEQNAGNTVHRRVDEGIAF